ncbi:MAG: helix-turn-helix domain-containing protein, partial [Caulobacteraceae bacterium]
MEKERAVQSVVRAFSVVEALNQRRVSSLHALHRTTGLPKPTLLRLLETLVEAGYAFHVSRREGYSLTAGVMRLSAGVRHRDVLVDAARLLMESFTREHKWQVSLATREGPKMVVRATTRHISPFSRETNYLERSCGILNSALGKAYFAFCPQDEREVILKLIRASAADDADLADDPEMVRSIVETVRARGYATIRRPRTNPYRSFAVPVMSGSWDGEVAAALVMFWYRSV